MEAKKADENSMITPNNGAAAAEGDQSPEQLIAKVNDASGEADALEPTIKKTAMDQMADDSNAVADPNAPKAVTGDVGKGAFWGKFNVYLLAFVLVIVIAGGTMAVMYSMDKKEQNVATNTAQLTQQIADQLKTADAKVGGPKQILTVESNAIITGKTIIQSDLDVAGALKLGGPLSLPAITVTGATQLGDIKGNSLEISGNGTFGGKLSSGSDLTIGGEFTAPGNITNNGNLTSGGNIIGGKSLTIQGSITASTGNLTIKGNGTFGGTISGAVVKAGEIQFGRLTLTGTQPTIAVGVSAGGGGTASVQGTDTAGTATINIGGAPSAGVIATVTFTTAFSTPNPHPVITANGSNCAVNAPYVTSISATKFSIALATVPSGGQSCKFNFIVLN